MFDFIASIIAFGLWKISAVIAGAFVLFLPFIFVWGVMALCDAMDNDKIDPRIRKWTLIITAVCTIPWFNFMTSTKFVGACGNRIIQSWTEYTTERSKPEVTKVVIGSELRQYILVDYNPPKHFYVTLKDAQTGQVYEHTYVSKHCNAHRDNKKGDTYNIQVERWHWSNSDAEYISFQNLVSVFC